VVAAALTAQQVVTATSTANQLKGENKRLHFTSRNRKKQQWRALSLATVSE